MCSAQFKQACSPVFTRSAASKQSLTLHALLKHLLLPILAYVLASWAKVCSLLLSHCCRCTSPLTAISCTLVLGETLTSCAGTCAAPRSRCTACSAAARVPTSASNSPSSLWGGTWPQVALRFLNACCQKRFQQAHRGPKACTGIAVHCVLMPEVTVPVQHACAGPQSAHEAACWHCRWAGWTCHSV